MKIVNTTTLNLFTFAVVLGLILVGGKIYFESGPWTAIGFAITMAIFFRVGYQLFQIRKTIIILNERNPDHLSDLLNLMGVK